MRKSEFELGFPTRGTKFPVRRTLDHGALTMKFAPESHLKMANLLQESAKAANGTKKRRLESLACAHQILAKRLEAKMKSTAKDAPQEIATANVPLMTHWIREPPGAFSATLEWELYLTELRSLPDSLVTRGAIESAEQMVAMKRAGDGRWTAGESVQKTVE